MSSSRSDVPWSTFLKNRAHVSWCLPVLGLLLLLQTACQSTSSADGVSTAQDPSAKSNKEELTYDPAIAFLTLTEIKPEATLPPAGPHHDDTSQRAAKQIAKAVDLYQQDRYTEALQRLERALRYSPNSLKAHELMAEVCLEAGNNARASQHLLKAIDLRPDKAASHRLRGKALARDEQWQEAIQSYRRALICLDLKRDVDLTSKVHFELAAVLHQTGYLTAASDQYAKVSDILEAERVTLLSESPSLQLAALMGRSDALERLGKFADAAESLRQARKLSPRNADLMLKAARLYSRAGHRDDAASVSKDLAEIDPRGVAMLSSIRRDQGKLDELVSDLRQLTKKLPNDYGIVEALVDELVSRDRLAPAISALRRFVTLRPDHAEAGASLSELLASHKQWDEALDVMVRTVEASSRPDEAVLSWLSRLRKTGQLEETYRRIAPRLDDPQLGATQAYLIGCLARQQQEHDVAERAFLLSESKRPEFVQAIQAVAQSYLDGYRWQKAADAARRAIERDAENALAHRLLGEALLGLDDYDRATEALNNAHRLDRSDIRSMQVLAEVYKWSGEETTRRKHQYQSILDIQSTNGEALEELFLIALHDGNGDSAKRYLRRLEGQTGRQSRFRRCLARFQYRQSEDRRLYVGALKEIVDEYPNDLAGRLLLARVHFGIREFKMAREQVERILAAQPDHVAATIMQGNLDLQDLEFRSAVSTFRRLLRRHPNRNLWQDMLVSALIDDQEYEAAAKLLEQYLGKPQLKPNYRGVFRFNLVMSYIFAQRSDRAVEALHTWLGLGQMEKRESAFLTSILLAVHQLRGDNDQAVRRAELLYNESGPDTQREARRLLRSAYVAAGRFADAEMLMLDQLEIDPDSKAATDSLTDVFQENDRFDDAIELARSNLPDTDEMTKFDLNNNLILLYGASRNFDEAIRLTRDQLGILADLNRGELLNRGDVVVEIANEQRARLCLYLINAQRYHEAESELSAWDRQDKRGRARAAILGLQNTCFQLNGKQSLAIRCLEELHQLNPWSPGNNNNLGYTLLSQDQQVDRAAEMIRFAVGANPRSAAYLDSLGWVLYRKGDFEGAGKWLERAARAPMVPWSAWLLGDREHQLGEDDAVINDHLGDAAWRLGDQDEAVKRWQRAYDQAAEQTDDLQPDYALIEQMTPKKIEAAKRGDEPKVAATVTD